MSGSLGHVNISQGSNKAHEHEIGMDIIGFVDFAISRQLEWWNGLAIIPLPARKDYRFCRRIEDLVKAAQQGMNSLGRNTTVRNDGANSAKTERSVVDLANPTSE